MFTEDGRALTRIQRDLQARQLAAVDIENISGGAIRTPQQARWVRRTLEDVIGIEQTQVVVGVSRAGLLPAYVGWGANPLPRYVPGHGVDGADLALLDVLERENGAARFEEVVLASGDGIFADVVARLGAQGVCVTVVGHRGRVSKRLIMAAAHVVLLGNSDQVGGAA